MAFLRSCAQCGCCTGCLTRCHLSPFCRSGGGDVAAACGQLAGTISEGKVPEEAGAGGADGNTVTDTWSGRWRTAPAETPAFLRADATTSGSRG